MEYPVQCPQKNVYNSRFKHNKLPPQDDDKELQQVLLESCKEYKKSLKFREFEKMCSILENGSNWQKECLRQDFATYYQKLAENEFNEFEKARNNFIYHLGIQNEMKINKSLN